jgi:hypothetical protein
MTALSMPQTLGDLQALGFTVRPLPGDPERTEVLCATQFSHCPVLDARALDNFEDYIDRATKRPEGWRAQFDWNFYEEPLEARLPTIFLTAEHLKRLALLHKDYAILQARADAARARLFEEMLTPDTAFSRDELPVR